jgi:hypothetical protein
MSCDCVAAPGPGLEPGRPRSERGWLPLPHPGISEVRAAGVEPAFCGSKPLILPVGRRPKNGADDGARTRAMSLEGSRATVTPHPRFEAGAAEGTRTPTQRIKSPLLCHSSSDGKQERRRCVCSRAFSFLLSARRGDRTHLKRIKNPLPHQSAWRAWSSLYESSCWRRSESDPVRRSETDPPLCSVVASLPFAIFFGASG